ncbi:hypothetical protein Pmani_036102 [Petrolisthes manimaculis]|uniref:Uncharacterized protein n=1 Tax=Petrolisthes manimaculis TaxID=1843537 RepID=A0AAE1NL26_9EUCA|nr:hypothetical protein Pmani_036102 [Petrolisthes manimaculis]
MEGSVEERMRNEKEMKEWTGIGEMRKDGVAIGERETEEMTRETVRGGGRVDMCLHCNLLAVSEVGQTMYSYRGGAVVLGWKNINVSKLVEDISRLQAALSGVREATAAQMHAMEEQLEQKNRLIHRLELKLEHSSIEEAKRDLQ